MSDGNPHDLPEHFGAETEPAEAQGPVDFPFDPPDQRETPWPGTVLLIFLLAHMPAAILMKRVHILSEIHFVIAVLLGLRWAFLGDIGRVAYLGAYIAGSDVLWRMTSGSRIIYESGKYGLSLVFLAAIVRSRSLRPPLIPLLYFLLLLPSIVVVLQNPDVARVRKDVSFNLSGPLALAVACWFYSGIRMSRDELLKVFWVALAPIVGISSIAFFWTVTSTNVVFNGESNLIASGGFGPNQVSALLGVGALLAFLCFILKGHKVFIRFLLLGFGLLFASQSALTFSRTGLLAAGCSALASGVSLCRETRARARLVLAAAVVSLVGYYAVVPFLDAFTEGGLTRRFSEKTTSGRGVLAEKDVEVFMSNLPLGVGPGGSKLFHEMQGDSHYATHSEVTRMLAEHGVLGVLALGMIVRMTLVSYFGARSPFDRGVRAALLSWALLIMTTNALRYAMPSLLFGLCCASFEADEDEDECV